MKPLLSPCGAILNTLATGLIAVSAMASGVYKVVDGQGNITYTDVPPAETVMDEVLLPAINPVSSPAPRTASNSEAIRSPESADAEPVMAFTGYSSAVLAAPLDGSLVHFDEPSLLVQVALTPPLEADHLVQFYVDGSAYGSAISTNSLSIGGLERGSHRISARVLSSQGAVLAITESVTVHVQRHFKRN